MSDLEIILWGIVIISGLGFVGCIISLIQERRLWNVKTEIWLEEYSLRLLTRSAMFFDWKTKK